MTEHDAVSASFNPNDPATYPRNPTRGQHIAIIKHWWAVWERVPGFRPAVLRPHFEAQLALYGGAA